MLDRDIKAERLKERDTACCIRKDRAGCVQSPKTECSKVGRMGGDMDDMGGGGGGGGDGTNVGGGPPRSNWVSVIVIEKEWRRPVSRFRRLCFILVRDSGGGIALCFSLLPPVFAKKLFSREMASLAV